MMIATLPGVNAHARRPIALVDVDAPSAPSGAGAPPQLQRCLPIAHSASPNSPGARRKPAAAPRRPRAVSTRLVARRVSRRLRPLALVPIVLALVACSPE